MQPMKRYIRNPKPRDLVGITGQRSVTPEGRQVVACMRWFVSRMLLDPRCSKNGFESMAMCAEIMQALPPMGEVCDMIEMPDSHWQLLQTVARKPEERAQYDAMFADTFAEFAQAIISAGTEPPVEKAK